MDKREIVSSCLFFANIKMFCKAHKYLEYFNDTIIIQ